jgi:hypothetical protein
MKNIEFRINIVQYSRPAEDSLENIVSGTKEQQVRKWFHIEPPAYKEVVHQLLTRDINTTRSLFVHSHT